jgi:hypothetical protein
MLENKQKEFKQKENFVQLPSPFIPSNHPASAQFHALSPESQDPCFSGFFFLRCCEDSQRAPVVGKAKPPPPIPNRIKV